MKKIIGSERYFTLKEYIEKLDKQQSTGYVPILYPEINTGSKRKSNNVNDDSNNIYCQPGNA